MKNLGNIPEISFIKSINPSIKILQDVTLKRRSDDRAVFLLNYILQVVQSWQLSINNEHN